MSYYSGHHQQTQSNPVSTLADLVGKEVRINRGGPDSVSGRLLAIQSNYIVIKTKDGIVYVNGTHIKSITLGDKTGRSGGHSSGHSSGGTGIILAGTFNNLLHRLTHQFVQINRGGPEKIEGFVVEVTNDYVLLVLKKEVVRIPIYHIKTIAVVGNKSGGNKSGNQNQNQNKSGQQKSGSNKSNDNRTTGGQRTSGGRSNANSGRKNSGGKRR